MDASDPQQSRKSQGHATEHARQYRSGSSDKRRNTVGNSASDDQHGATDISENAVGDAGTDAASDEVGSFSRERSAIRAGSHGQRVPLGMVEVAQLGRSHGLEGELYLRPLSDVPDRVVVGMTLTTRSGAEVKVVGLRPLGDRQLVRLAGVTTVEQAKLLAGSMLYAVPLEDPPLTLVSDLIGKQFFDQAGVEHGTVVAVQANPASELMVLEGGELVPTLFLVDVFKDRVVADVPEGLFEL